MIKAVRGATGISANKKKIIEESVVQLLNGVVKTNDIDETKIVSIIFSQTHDITAMNPAAALRTDGFAGVPLFCTQEPKVKGSPKKLIRVLVTYETESDDKPIPVYINGAQALRPDIFECTMR
jgi:chorismate mutase